MEEDDELAIAVFFHPAKLFNSDNFRRFINSNFSQIAVKVDLGIDTYMVFTQKGFSDQEVANAISKLLHTVYRFQPNTEFEFKVNTYS